MACGDRYRGLLLTASGRGPNDPCWAFCGINDYGETRDVATSIADQVLRRWNHLLSIELRRSAKLPADLKPAEAWPERQQLSVRLDDFYKLMSDLPHPLLETLAPRSQLGYDQAVARAWAAAEAGICVMQMLDDASTYYTGSALPAPPEVTKPPPGGDGKGSLDTIVTFAAIGAGVWLWRKGKKAA